MLRRLTDSEEDNNDNWLQAYMAGEYERYIFTGDSKSFSQSLEYMYHADVLVC